MFQLVIPHFAAKLEARVSLKAFKSIVALPASKTPVVALQTLTVKEYGQGPNSLVELVTCITDGVNDNHGLKLELDFTKGGASTGPTQTLPKCTPNDLIDTIVNPVDTIINPVDPAVADDSPSLKVPELKDQIKQLTFLLYNTYSQFF